MGALPNFQLDMYWSELWSLWQYLANRFLTLVENMLTGAKLSEYHSGYRAFSRQLLEQLNLQHNSDDFVFDNQMLA